MITQIRRFLGVETDEEKFLRFRELNKSLSDVDKRIDLLADDFSDRYREKTLVMKSDQPEFVKAKVNEKFEEFLKSQRELVVEVKKEKEAIKKQLDPLLKIESFVKILEDEKNYSIVKGSYKDGTIGEEVFDKFYKAKQGKVLYADNLVFNEEGKLLLLKRSKTDKTQPDTWVIPGGHVDLGEEFEDAAKRELQEESGLNADQVTLVGEYSNNEVQIKYYRSTVNSQEQLIILQESEMQDYVWINPQTELCDYDFPFNMKDNIKKILKIKESPNVVIVKALEDGIIDKNKFLEIMKSKIHKYSKKTPDGKGGFNYEYPEDKKDSTKGVEELDKLEAQKLQLLNEVDPLIKLKKKLYSKVDIESPKSEEEKKLDKKIADLFSEINSIVHEKNKIKKDINQKKENNKSEPIQKAVNPEKVAYVMGEFKAGKLKDSAGNVVTERKQAIAIAISEAKRKDKSEEDKIEKTKDDSIIRKAIESLLTLFRDKKIDEPLLLKTIEKSRTGVYADTAYNRKLHRVGHKYGSKGQEEAPKGDKGKQQEQPTHKDLSSEELKDFAEQASESSLQSAIKQSPDPEVRKVAHEELDRRTKEEHVQEEEKKDGEDKKKDNTNRIKDLPKGKIFDDAKSLEGVFKKSNKSWSEVIEFFEKNKDNAKVEEVSLKDIHITQPNIQSNKVEKMINDIDKTPTIDAVQFKDGEISIFDGHHRLASLWSLGKEKIKVNLVKEGQEKKDGGEKKEEKQKENRFTYSDDSGLKVLSEKDILDSIDKDKKFIEKGGTQEISKKEKPIEKGGYEQWL